MLSVVAALFAVFPIAHRLNLPCRHHLDTVFSTRSSCIFSFILASSQTRPSLQMNLLSEQKIAKLIDLIEELRRDLPNVRERHDPEAEVLKQAADPHLVVSALEERLEEELADFQKQENSGQSSN